VNGLPLDSGNLKTGRNFWRKMEWERGREEEARSLGVKETERGREKEQDNDVSDIGRRRRVVGVSYWYFIVRSA